MTRSATPLGTVAFVGTGPGRADLLTVRAADLLGRADAVAVDDGYRPAALSYCRPGMPITDLERGDGSKTAAAARAKVLVELARQGGLVVRLLPGDPFLVAGAADEVAAAVRSRVAVEIVPGVPPSTSVPLHAGVALTGGDVTDVRVVDVTGPGVDWDSLAAGSPTLVLLGAMSQLEDVAGQLVACGRKPNTPVSVTVDGGTPNQRTVAATLADVAAEVRAAELSGNAVVVVGDVVARRPRLSWFESRPLFGWRVLVPRTKEQAAALTELLDAQGAIGVEVPTIAVEPPRTPQQMDRAVKGLVTGRYEWIAFTSRNAVRAIRERFDQLGLDARAFAGIKIAAVGEQTAADLRAWGLVPDLVPSGEQSAAGLVADWPPYDPVFDPINRVFLPRADIATETLVAGLVELGWEVDDVTAYRTVRAAPPPAEIRDAIKSGGFDAVLFTSSSTVRNLVGIAGKPHPSTVVAVIGPATARTAEEHGLRIDVVAPAPSVVELVRALADFGAARRDAALAAGEAPVRPSERRTPLRRKK